MQAKEKHERYLFYRRKQKNGEPFDTFLMDIKRLVRCCEFGEKKGEMLRDAIVMGIQDEKVQLRFLEKSDLTYIEAVEKGSARRSNERANQHDK